MGIQPGKRAWERSTESQVLNNQEAGLNNSDLVRCYEQQAINYIVQNKNFVSVIIGSGIRDTILSAKNKLSAAKFEARNNTHLLPDTIDELDHQAAFLIAVAEKLSGPEYNQ